MRFWILFIFVLISICTAYPVYVPIEFDKYPGYAYGYSWPVYKSITKYDSTAEEFKDYWLTFKDEFERSYKEITKPYIVERAVPIPVPVPINRVRTVIIKPPTPRIVYRKIRYFKPYNRF